MTILVGLIGWPLGHSVSPAMHNAAFQALGLDGRYEALPVPPEQVGDLVRSLHARGFRGVNVTIPHKQAVMPLMDELSEAAQRIGAVNTIIVEPDGRLRGDNTDWLGFLHPLDERGFDLAGKSVLLLGAGGTARAVVYALVQRNIARLAIWNRNLDRAEALARHAAALDSSLTIDNLKSALTIVNSTIPPTIPSPPFRPDRQYHAYRHVAAHRRVAVAGRIVLSARRAGVRPGLSAGADAVFTSG